MPRADITKRDEWRAQLRAAQADRAAQIERWVQIGALILLMATVLYVMIGHSPYTRGVAVDAETGGIEVSPVNRYVWILLGAGAMPILLARRHMLIGAAKRIWPLLLLYGWFTLTTRWALDPGTSSKRLFLYIITLIVALAIALGFNSGKRFHHALAITCGVMVGIDVLSWLAMPGLSMTPLGLAAIHNHKNSLGSVMLFSCLILLPYAFAQRTARGTWFWGSMFAAAFVLLVASKSKTSLGILVAILATTPLLLGVLKMKGKTIAAIAMGLLLSLFGGALMWLAYCTSTGRNPLAPFYGITFTQRTDVWAFVILEIMKRPFAGSGFASFWDIDPTLQPSLQSGLWFAQMDAFTNEAHNGYLDLLVTTGFVGLIGAMIVLFRWVIRGMAQMRQALRSSDPEDRWNLPYIVSLGIFPLIIVGHNLLESSYFTANSFFGTLILLIGVDLDLRYRKDPAAFARRTSTLSRPSMTATSRA